LCYFFCLLKISRISLFKKANHYQQVSPWQAAHSISLWKIRKYINLLIIWVGFLVAQKQSRALGFRGKNVALELPA
jgi:hypothetical protein